MAQSAVLENPQDTKSDDELDHWYCMSCHPDGEIAFCGENLVGYVDYGIDENGEHITCSFCGSLEWCPECDGYGD